MTAIKYIVFIGSLALWSCGAVASENSFKTGPVFEKFGESAVIESDLKLPPETKFKISFDVAEAAKPGELNRRFNSLARFVNMHVSAGVPQENIELALVVHGAASKDLLNTSAYPNSHAGQKNANAALIQALMEKGTPVYLCGQSAVYHGVDKSDLIPGVKMALSAMTAHAILQQDGFTLNPF